MPVRITAKTDGFRRCGMAHGREPVDYPDGHWSGEQLAILKAEPELVVVEIEQRREPESGKEAAEKAANGKVTPIRLNAAKSIELVRTAATMEELDRLIIDQGEDRKSVLEAIAKRRAELTPEP